MLDSNGINVISGFFQDKRRTAGLWKGSAVGHVHSSPTQFPKHCHPRGPAGLSLSVKHGPCHTALVTVLGARGNDTALPSSGAWLSLLMGPTKRAGQTPTELKAGIQHGGRTYPWFCGAQDAWTCCSAERPRTGRPRSCWTGAAERCGATPSPSAQSTGSWHWTSEGEQKCP